MCRCVCYEFFFFVIYYKIVVKIAVVLEIVTWGVFICATTPRAISKKTGPFYFIRISQSRYFFGRFRFFRSFLFVASIASKCELLNKDQSDFYHKDLVRVYQKQNLALSWFKPASTLTSKCECWCEFEKDLELLPLRKFLRICVGMVFLIELPTYSTRASVFIFCEWMFFQICIDTWALLLKYLWFCQT